MLPSIASGGLELHLPFITMYRCRLSRATVHGRQNVFGGTLPTLVMHGLSWETAHTCTKRQLQSLLGSLLYITKCVRYSRFFLNRMLGVLREHKGKIG